MKLLLLGPPVGKSAFIKRFFSTSAHGMPSSTTGTAAGSSSDSVPPTVGIDLHLHQIPKPPSCVTIWDVSHTELEGTQLQLIFNGVSGVLLFVDLTDATALQQLDAWCAVVWRHVPSRDIPVLLVVIRRDSANDIYVTDEQLGDYCRGAGLRGWKLVSLQSHKSVKDSVDSVVGHMFQYQIELINRAKREKRTDDAIAREAGAGGGASMQSVPSAALTGLLGSLDILSLVPAPSAAAASSIYDASSADMYIGMEREVLRQLHVDIVSYYDRLTPLLMNDGSSSRPDGVLLEDFKREVSHCLLLLLLLLLWIVGVSFATFGVDGDDEAAEDENHSVLILCLHCGSQAFMCSWLLRSIGDSLCRLPHSVQC